MNPYLSEVSVAIPDYTQHAYFFEGCKSSFQNVRQSIADDINRAIEEEQEKERKKKERKKSKPPALTFDHDGVKLNQQEEIFYQALVEALDGLIEEKDIELLAKTQGKTVEEIHNDTERDNWLSAQEAMDYGIVDKVFYKR